MSGVYPPGSTIKMAVALAALENGIIDYNTKFYCNGSKELGTSKFHCWAKDGHGKLNLMVCDRTNFQRPIFQPTTILRAMPTLN